jgi:hypothetical protein
MPKNVDLEGQSANGAINPGGLSAALTLKPSADKLPSLTAD